MSALQLQDWLTEAFSLHSQGHALEDIFHKLREKGLSETFIPELRERFRKALLSRKRARGMKFIGLGSLLLVAGFLIAILSFMKDDNFRIALYGLTSVGIILVLKGVVDFTGW